MKAFQVELGQEAHKYERVILMCHVLEKEKLHVQKFQHVLLVVTRFTQTSELGRVTLVLVTRPLSPSKLRELVTPGVSFQFGELSNRGSPMQPLAARLCASNLRIRFAL